MSNPNLILTSENQALADMLGVTGTRSQDQELIHESLLELARIKAARLKAAVETKELDAIAAEQEG